MFKDRIKMGDQVTVALGTPRLVLHSLFKAGHIGESKWEGITTEKRPVYVVYERATLSIRAGKSGETSARGAKELFSVRYGRTPKDSIITLEEVARLSEERFDFSNVLHL